MLPFLVVYCCFVFFKSIVVEETTSSLCTRVVVAVVVDWQLFDLLELSYSSENLKDKINSFYSREFVNVIKFKKPLQK